MKKLVIQIAICFFAGLLLAACKEDPAPVFNIPADEIAKLTPFSAAGEIQSIVLEASGNVIATSDQPDWCIPVYAYRHKQLFFDVKPNEGVARTAIVTVQSEGFQDATIPISQLGAPPSLRVTEATDGIVLVNDNREFTLDIVANFEVAVDLPGWISENGTNPGADGRTWSFTAETMPAAGTREANITVRSNDPAVSISPVTVHVQQVLIAVNIEPRPVRYVEFTDGNKATITWEAAPADNAYVEVEWQKQDYTTSNVHVAPGTNVTECTNTVYSPSAIRYRSVVIVEGNEIAGGWQTYRHPEYNLVMIGSGTMADWLMNDADELTFDPANPYVYTWSGHLRWGVMRFYTHREYSGIIISCTVANTSPEATMSLQLRWGDTNLHDFNFGEYDQGDYDVVVDLNNMTITFTRK